MLTKITYAAVAVGAVLALAGCDKTLKTDSIEPQIKKAIEQRGTKVTAVTCPGNVTAKKGTKFECTVKTTDGKSGKIEITQTDGSGHVVFQPNDIKYGG